MAVNLGSIFFGINAQVNGFQQAIAALQQLGTGANQTTRAQTQLAAANQKTALTMQELARSTSLITGPLSGIGYRLTVLGELFRSVNVTMLLFAAGAATAAYAFVKLSEAAIKNEIDLSRHRQQLFLMTGSMVEANIEMTYLMNTANKFGIPFDEVANNFVKLNLAAQGTKLAGEGIRQVFQDLTAYAGNFQLSQEQLTSILGHVETGLTRGRIQWREVQQVLSRDIPAATQIATKAMGMTRAAFDISVKRGDILSDDFWAKFSAELLKFYHIDASQPVDSLVASLSRLHNAESLSLRAFDNAIGIGEQYHGTLDRISTALSFLTSHMKEVITTVGTLGGAFLAYFAAGTIISGLTAVASAFIAVRTAVIAMNVAMLAIPGVTLLRLASAAIAAAVAFFYMRDAIGENADSVKSSNTDIDAYIDLQRKLKTSNIEVTQSYIDKQRAQLAASEEALKSANVSMSSPVAPAFELDKLNKAKSILENIMDLAPKQLDPFGIKDKIDPFGVIEALKNIQVATDETVKHFTTGDIAKAIGGDTSKSFWDTMAAQLDPFGVAAQLDPFGLSKPIKDLTTNAVNQISQSKITLKMSAEDFGTDFWETMKKQLDPFNIRNDLDPFKLAGPLKDLTLQTFDQIKSIPIQGTNIWDEVDKAQARVNAIKQTIDESKKRIESLNKILTDQKKQAPPGGTELEESGPQKRIRLAKESIDRFTSESNRQFNAMKEGPLALQDVLEKIDIEKKIEGWRKQLEEAGMTAAEAAPYVDKAAAAFTKLRDAQKADKDFVTVMQLVTEETRNFGNTLISTFATAVSQHRSLSSAFRNMWTSVLDEVMKKILQLAVLGPIMNALFGTKDQTLTFGTPGSATGGIMGSIVGSSLGGTDSSKGGTIGGGGGGLGGIFGGMLNKLFPSSGLSASASDTGAAVDLLHGGSGAKSSRFVSMGMFTNAVRLHQGLKAGEYPAVLQHGETVTPRGGGVGGNVPFEVHVHEAPGQPTQQMASKTAKGTVRLDIMMKKMATDAVQEDIAKGGALSTFMERKYSLDRTSGMA